MKIIDSIVNWFTGKTATNVDTQDLYNSRYISLYEHRRRKREYREHLEKTTLDRVNYYLVREFPKNIKKEEKKEIIDCTVVFLKYITINYDYFPGGDVFEKEFNKVITKNIEKFKK
jgi:hypothetical protein